MMPKADRLLSIVAAVIFLTALPAAAQVAALNSWAYGGGNVPTGVNFTQTVNLTVSAGTNRLFVAACILEAGSAGTVSNFNATLGGTALTPIGTTETNSQRMTIKTWYLLNAGIPGAATSLVVSGAHTQTPSGMQVYWACYSGVDQASPIVSSNAGYNGAANITFGATINYLAGGMTFYVAGNGGTPATETTPTDFTQDATSTTQAFTGFAADTAAHAAAGSYAASTAVTFGGTTSTRSVISVASLRPAASCTAPVITVQPANSTVCAGANTSFSVTATGSSLTYQWQVNTGTWGNVTNGGVYSGASTNTLTITGATAGMTGYQYRCVVSSGACSTTSNAATLTVNTAPAISAQPANSTICSGSNTSFSITATGTGIAYQWQVNTGTWGNVTDGGVYSGATTNTLSITGATAGMNGYQYRCVVTGACAPAATSTAATLTISGTAPVITAHPSNSTVCAGANTTFSVTATGSSLTYQWQVNTGTWGNVANGGVYSGATTVTLAITGATAGMNGYQYRCVVSSGGCGATSNAATLTVNAAPSITAQPANANGCGTGNASFSITAAGLGLAYQWQENQGAGWNNLANGGVYSGATLATLSLTGVTGAMNGYQYRCVVSGTCAPPATSNAATLTWAAVCATNPTTVVSNSVQISSCRQLTVTAAFTGDDNGNGSTLVEYNTTNTWPGTTACAALTGSSPRVCLVTGLSPSPAQYWVRVSHTDPDGVSGTNPQALGAYAMPVCGSDQVAPTITFLSPGRDAILGGADTLKIQVFDAGLASINSATVQWSVDGGAAAAMTRNANYSCDDPEVPNKCGVFEATLNTLATGTNPKNLANKKHTLTITASDGTNTAVASRSFTVNNVGGSATATGTAPAGGGTLLRRTSGAQLCLDCHNLETHSSQYTSTKYGNWAVDCQVCHVPHGTRNIHLVPEIIATLNSGAKAIDFHADDRAGGTDPQDSYLGAYDGSGLPYDDGVCEACHTKTNHYRNDASGGDHSHNRSTRCVGCHAHASGFNAQESRGCAVLTQIEAQCSNCHPAIWNGMTDAAKASKHLLGGTAGTNDACSDSSVTWASPLNAVAAASRSCVNMCHPDHAHNTPGTPGSTHENNAYKEATSPTTRALARDAAGAATLPLPAGSLGVAATDFDNTATNGGMCLSCHRYPVESGANPAHPAVDKATYFASAHEGTITSVPIYTPGAAPTHRATTTPAYTGTAASFTINKPTGTVQGDLMIANIAWSTNNNNTNPPACTGWTLLTQANWGNANPYRHGATLYKVAGASEGGNYTFAITVGTTTAWVVTGTISSFFGVDANTPIEVVGAHASSNTAGTTITATGITTLTNNSLVAFFSQVGIANATHTNWSTATAGAMTEINDSTLAAAMNVGAATLADATAGATGNGTVTITSATWGGVLLAVKPVITVTTTDYPWTYAMHDTSTFLRNCTKCHAGDAEKAPGASASPFTAVHFGDNPALLAGKVNPASVAANDVCYNCHGNGLVGGNYSGHDIYTPIAKAAGTGSAATAHPVDDDTVHSTSGEASDTFNSGKFSGTNRHVNCLDCHEAHAAQKILHTEGGASGNAIAATSPLIKVSGVSFTPPTGTAPIWAANTSSNFTWIPSSTAATKEYEICFKCHTAWGWGTTAPSGVSANGTQSPTPETDVATEFNPNNRSGHPVVAALNDYANSINVTSPTPTHKGLEAAQLLAPWNTNVGANTMTCSDCHGNDASTAGSQGPHGSAYRWLLAGPNTYWPTNSAGTLYSVGSATASTRAGLFCLNCHPDQGLSATATPGSNNMHSMVRGQHSNITYSACVSCHIVIPHGGKISRLLGTNTAGLPARYAYNGTASQLFAVAWAKSTTGRNGYGQTSFKTACSTHSGSTASEAW